MRYFEQPIDHFSFSTLGGASSTFMERYLVDNTYVRTESPPILFYTGNEGDIFSFYRNSKFMFDVAQNVGGLLVFAEHRYYGTTKPFGDRSFTAENVRWLTSAQALADYASLALALQSEYSKPGMHPPPVIAFGGSLGGMMRSRLSGLLSVDACNLCGNPCSAWFRLKYPHIVAGSIASSAPVRGFDGLTDPNEFNRIVTKDFEDVEPRCADLIRKVVRGNIPAVYNECFFFTPGPYSDCATQPSGCDRPAAAFAAGTCLQTAHQCRRRGRVGGFH